MSKRIVIMGNYGGVNWGDEAILAGLIASVRDRDLEMTIVSANPDFSRRLHGEKAAPLPPAGIRSFIRHPRAFRSFLRLIDAADEIVIGGGGIFQDREWRAVFLWGWYCFWASRSKKPLLLVAQSVGPLRFSWSRVLARWVFQKAAFLSVRDAGSASMLAEIGIENKKIVQSTDAVFALPFADPPASRRGTILALRGDGVVTLSTAKALVANLPHPVTAAVLDRADRRFASTLGVPVWEPAGLDDLRQTIRAAELVVSARLHGNLIALLEQTPFVALSAAPKVRAFFADRNLSDWVMPETASAAEITHKAIDLLTNRPATQETLDLVRKAEAGKAADIWPPDFASDKEILHTQA